jgi:putative RNA 2'-phosphotransferase
METKQLSKFLSLVLRHQPEKIGISLDEQGWTAVPILLPKMNITLAQLEYVVENNDKKRFVFNADQTQIRANQGHSVEINLGYLPSTPPSILFHGTAKRNLNSILEQGILKQARHHVHLSSDKNTAHTVGSRYGLPIVLMIDAQKMHDDGLLFYCSDNNVWLTDRVEAKYINSHIEKSPPLEGI